MKHITVSTWQLSQFRHSPRQLPCKTWQNGGCAYVGQGKNDREPYQLRAKRSKQNASEQANHWQIQPVCKICHQNRTFCGQINVAALFARPYSETQKNHFVVDIRLKFQPRPSLLHSVAFLILSNFRSRAHQFSSLFSLNLL